MGYFMKRSSEQKEPYSIRCLKAIIEMYGGRGKMAKLLGTHRRNIDYWIRVGNIAPHWVLELAKLGEGKFSEGELLGKFDKTDG
jgi:hypothetical protein